jgi:hypothetical protein
LTRSGNPAYFLGVYSESLAQRYSSKTDDELLRLAADSNSLLEEAQHALADELRRRNLVGRPVPDIAHSDTDQIAHLSANSSAYRAKWVGLWLLNTLIATLGIAINVGFFTYSTHAFVSRATRIYFVETPYYPFPILVGLVVGYLSYLRFRGSYRYWVWILPAVYMLYPLADWKSSNQTTWSKALIHFFGFVPFPQNRDQLGTSVWLYMALAYSVGALVQGFVAEKRWLTRFPRLLL